MFIENTSILNFVAKNSHYSHYKPRISQLKIKLHRNDFMKIKASIDKINLIFINKFRFFIVKNKIYKVILSFSEKSLIEI